MIQHDMAISIKTYFPRLSRKIPFISGRGLPSDNINDPRRIFESMPHNELPHTLIETVRQ